MLMRSLCWYNGLNCLSMIAEALWWKVWECHKLLASMISSNESLGSANNASGTVEMRASIAVVEKSVHHVGNVQANSRRDLFSLPFPWSSVVKSAVRLILPSATIDEYSVALDHQDSFQGILPPKRPYTVVFLVHTTVRWGSTSRSDGTN